MSEPEAPVRPGDVLAGKYRVEKILGAGGMGVVVAAFHLELEQRVALKFLLPAAAKKPEVIARFSREARALAKIRSEHVARVMDVGALEDGTPYIMMEHLEGRDLSEVLKQAGSIPVVIAVDYMLQACVALAEAHAVGIVHRDLKPSNLFLARQPDGIEILKLLDFGIAKMPLKGAEEIGEVGVTTTTTDMFGSPRYMSPEQLKSFRDVDARTDLWALGVIFYETVAGVSPFRRDTLGEILWSVAFDEPQLLCDLQPTVPEALARIIARCLQKDPAQRYANAAELAQALLPFGSSDAAALVERAGRMSRRAGLSLDAESPRSEEAPALSSTRSGAEKAPPKGAPTADGGTTITSAVAVGDTLRAQSSRAPRQGRWRPVVALSATLLLIAVASVGVLLLPRLRAAPVVADATNQASSGATAPLPAQVAPPSSEPVTPPSSLSPEMMPSAAPTTAAAASASAVPLKGKLHGRRGQPRDPVERSPGAGSHEFGDRR